MQQQMNQRANKDMVGLVTMKGKTINKRKHLLSHTNQNGRPTFDEMDQLLKENGIKYSMIVDKLQLLAQRTKSS